ncbi:MAG: hypothetical protein M3463_17460, partial [Verrucomicrobiota bacterium]|nr:hypothetical protein [Verrucomicrobiota bacterium]
MSDRAPFRGIARRTFDRHLVFERALPEVSNYRPSDAPHPLHPEGAIVMRHRCRWLRFRTATSRRNRQCSKAEFQEISARFVRKGRGGAGLRIRTDALNETTASHHGCGGVTRLR